MPKINAYGVIEDFNYGAPTSELGVMTDGIASEYIQKDNATLDRISGKDTAVVPPVEGATRVFSGQNQVFRNGNWFASDIAPQATGQATGQVKEPGKIKFVNLNGQVRELTGEAITPDAVESLKNQGFYSTDTIGDVPSWASTEDITAGRMNAELVQAKKEKDDLLAGIQQFAISDAELNSQMQTISAQYDARIRSMEDINRRRTEAMKTLGVRLGSRYAGGAGGVFGGIVTEEERQGAQRVSALEAEKNAAIQAAKSAAKTQNWTIFSKQVDIATQKYEDQQKEIENWNKAVVENNKKIAEEQKIKLDTEKTLAEVSKTYAEQLAPYVSTFLTGDKEIDSKLYQSISEAHGLDPEFLAGTVERYRNEQELKLSTTDYRDFILQGGTPGDTKGFKAFQDEQKRKVGASITPTQIFDRELKLSKDFEGYAKNLREAQRQIKIIETSYKQAQEQMKKGESLNAATQGVLVSFQKLLDPTSVVRESEYARSPEGLSLLDRIEGTYTRLKQGGAGLTADALKEFVDMGKKFYENYNEELINFARRTKAQAESIGAKLENILTPSDLKLLKEADRPRIRVKEKSSGKTGTIYEDEYDVNLYEKLE